MKKLILLLIILLVFITLYVLTFGNLTPMNALGGSILCAFMITFLLNQYKRY